MQAVIVAFGLLVLLFNAQKHSIVENNWRLFDFCKNPPIFDSLSTRIMMRIFDYLKSNLSSILYNLGIYLISLVLLAFSFPKFYNGQFQIFQYTEYWPLKEIPPFIHAWSFFGRSYAYNLFLGIAEFSAACMILFPRTRLVGLLLALGMYLNILLIDIVFEVNDAIGHVVVEFVIVLLLLRPYYKDLFGFLIRMAGRLHDAPLPQRGKFARVFPWIFIAILSIMLSVEGTMFMKDQAQTLARFEVQGWVIDSDTLLLRPGKYTPAPMLFLEFGNTFAFAVNDSVKWGGYERNHAKLDLHFNKPWFGINEIQGRLLSGNSAFEGKDNLGRRIFMDLATVQ